MRRFLCLFMLAAAATIARADGVPVALGEGDASAIPTELPGLELRTLDQTKVIRFTIGGRLAEVEVPLFAYVPVEETTATATMALKLRALSDRLAGELTTPEVDRVAVREVAQALDAIIAELVLPKSRTSSE